MKRVLLGVWIYPHGAGGVEHFLARLFTCLRRRGFDILCFASSAGRGTSFFRKQGFEVVIIRKGLEVERLTGLLRSRRVDLVMTTMYEATAARASFSAGIPHVWRCGGLIRVAGTLSRAKREEMPHVIDLLSDAIVANSKAVAAQFDGVCREKVFRIPNGLPIGARFGTKTDLKRRFSWSRSQPVVAMAAHYYPVKRHEDFIRAAAKVAVKVRGSRFVIFGDVFSGAAGRRMKKYASWLDRLPAAARLGAKLALVRRMDDLSGVIQQVDIVVHPCPDESLPNAVLEAMAAGKPVVGADRGGCSELLSHGRTGILVPSGRPGRMAAEICKLLKDPRKARRLGAAARRQILRRYDIRTATRRYEKVIRKLLSAKKKPKT